MENNSEKQINLDILRRVEELSQHVNSTMSRKTQSVFHRYPLTFMLVIFVGAVALSEGLKELITKVSFFDNHPWRLFLAGLFILTITGTLYKKLDK